mmetsp:Transcript_50606/g.152484  ORF Transcript_50606/g.152484 Transcript_50606/m.152484 type:complete len:89 (+) Transcript_50606:685-951(+)
MEKSFSLVKLSKKLLSRFLEDGEQSLLRSGSWKIFFWGDIISYSDLIMCWSCIAVGMLPKYQHDTDIAFIFARHTGRSEAGNHVRVKP